VTENDNAESTRYWVGSPGCMGGRCCRMPATYCSLDQLVINSSADVYATGKLDDAEA